MNRIVQFGVSAVAAAAIGIGAGSGIAAAFDGEDEVTGPDADRARAAAVQAVPAAPPEKSRPRPAKAPPPTACWSPGPTAPVSRSTWTGISGFWTPNRPTGTAVSIGACPHRATDSLRVRTDEI